MLMRRPVPDGALSGIRRSPSAGRDAPRKSTSELLISIKRNHQPRVEAAESQSHHIVSHAVYFSAPVILPSQFTSRRRVLILKYSQRGKIYVRPDQLVARRCGLWRNEQKITCHSRSDASSNHPRHSQSAGKPVQIRQMPHRGIDHAVECSNTQYGCDDGYKRQTETLSIHTSKIPNIGM